VTLLTRDWVSLSIRLLFTGRRILSVIALGSRWPCTQRSFIVFTPPEFDTSMFGHAGAVVLALSSSSNPVCSFKIETEKPGPSREVTNVPTTRLCYQHRTYVNRKKKV